MGPCLVCNGIPSGPLGKKGFYLDAGWAPGPDSPPGLERWSVRILEEIDGVVTLRGLSADQVKEIGASGALGVVSQALMLAISEIAKLKREVADMRRQIALIASQASVPVLPAVPAGAGLLSRVTSWIGGK